jgi:hypothetical protein
VHDLSVVAPASLETKLAEHLRMAAFSGRTSDYKFVEASCARQVQQVLRQHRSDPLAWIGIDHHEGNFGFTGLGHDVASAADDHAPAAFVDCRNQRNVVDEVDIQEEKPSPSLEIRAWSQRSGAAALGDTA